MTNKYDVLVDVPINSKIHRKGGTVELTERHAQYLLLAGKIALAKAPAKSIAASKGSAKSKHEVKSDA